MRESKELIDKQCRDIGDAKMMSDGTEAEAAEKNAQLETVLRQKDKEVQEARYQSPPRSEWLVQGGKLTHAIRRIYTDACIGRPLRSTLCVYAMLRAASWRDIKRTLNKS